MFCWLLFMPGKMDSRAKSNSPESPNAVLVCGFGTETIGSISFLCFAVVRWPLTNSYICAFCRALGAIRRRLILSGSRQSSYNWPECAKPSPYFHTIILPIDPIVSSSSSPSPYRYISNNCPSSFCFPSSSSTLVISLLTLSLPSSSSIRIPANLICCL